MNQTAKKWLTFSLRWGVAVVGIWYVLAKTPFHDRLLLLENHQLLPATVLDEPPEDAPAFTVVDPLTGVREVVRRSEVWTQPDRAKVKISYAGNVTKVKLLAIRLGTDYQAGQPPAEILVSNPTTGKPLVLPPTDVVGGYKVHVPYPMVDIGVVRLVQHANLTYLLGAIFVLPVSYLIVSRRWNILLAALEVHLSQMNTFVLNAVGMFYNSFMPGSTGGDLLKAYYASKYTTHKVRAVLSVIVDRLLGVMALIILGGAACATQWTVPDCQKVGLVCAAIICCTIVGLVVFYHPAWRRAMGLDWLIKNMPMQRQIHHAVEAMELYGKRPGAALTALVMTFPVHMTSIISGTLAGMAFGLKMPAIYYWTVVPVIALVGAIPISPQGAGVMEAFSILLTKNHGVTVSQAIALAMAVRFGQMFWNLVAGLFVLRGGYHAPSARETEGLEEDDEPEPALAGELSRTEK